MNVVHLEKLNTDEKREDRTLMVERVLVANAEMAARQDMTVGSTVSSSLKGRGRYLVKPALSKGK